MRLFQRPDSPASQPLSADQLPKPQGDIHEVIHRADAELRRQSRTDAVAENLNMLVRRIVSIPTEEIDRVILELQRVRDTLCGEGERVSREITGYANLKASMSAMQAIGATFKQWNAPNPPSPAAEHVDGE